MFYHNQLLLIVLFKILDLFQIIHILYNHLQLHLILFFQNVIHHLQLDFFIQMIHMLHIIMHLVLQIMVKIHLHMNLVIYAIFHSFFMLVFLNHPALVLMQNVNYSFLLLYMHLTILKQYIVIIIKQHNLPHTKTYVVVFLIYLNLFLLFLLFLYPLLLSLLAFIYIH